MTEQKISTIEKNDQKDRKTTPRTVGGLAVRDGQLVAAQVSEPEAITLPDVKFEAPIDSSIEAVQESVKRVFSLASSYARERAHSLSGANGDVTMSVLYENDTSNSELEIIVDEARNYTVERVYYTTDRGTVNKRGSRNTVDVFKLNREGLTRSYCNTGAPDYETQLLAIDKTGEIAFAEGIGPKRQNFAAAALVILEQRLSV